MKYDFILLTGKFLRAIFNAKVGLRWGYPPQTPTRVLNTLDPQ